MLFDFFNIRRLFFIFYRNTWQTILNFGHLTNILELTLYTEVHDKCIEKTNKNLITVICHLRVSWPARNYLEFSEKILLAMCNVYIQFHENCRSVHGNIKISLKISIFFMSSTLLLLSVEFPSKFHETYRKKT